MASLRQELDKVVLETLRPLTVVLGPFLLWTAYADRNDYTGPVATMPMWADIGVGSFLLLTGILAFTLKPDAKWAHPWGLSVIIMLSMTALTALIVRGHPATVPTMTIIALGAGIVMLSTPWLVAALAVVASAWLLGTQGMPASLVEPPQFLLQVAIILSLVVGWARIRAYSSIIAARNDAQAAHARVADLNDELERFAAVVTHDLQTPLSALRLKAKIAKAAIGKDESRIIEALSEIDRIAGDSGVFVHEMLEYARSGQGMMHRETVDMEEMLAHVHKLVESRLVTVGGRLEWHDLPDVVGDPVLLRQLILNLVSNSIRYQHPERPIHIRVTGQADVGGVSLTFEDNGIGLDPAQAERLFQPFELGNTGQEKGHGLGLATCKRIVDAHGGTIAVDGEPGQGATFIVELPTASAQRAQAPLPS